MGRGPRPGPWHPLATGNRRLPDPAAGVCPKRGLHRRNDSVQPGVHEHLVRWPVCSFSRLVGVGPVRCAGVEHHLEPVRQHRTSRRLLRPWMLNIGVWTLFGLLQAATWLLAPIRGGYPNALPLIAIALFNAYLWAILTPLIFPLAAKVSQAKGRRVRWLILVVALGLIVAALLLCVSGSGPRLAHARRSAFRRPAGRA